MQVRTRPPSNPAYLRSRARRFRACANDAGDAIIYAELLALAALYERMATEAEDDAKTHVADE